MSWHSTIEYYRAINEQVAGHRGGHHSAPLLLESLDFDAVRAAQVAEDWATAADLLAGAGERLVAAGADTLVICTNLMHKVAPEVEARAGVPLLHIADAVAGAVADTLGDGVGRTVGLLGTRWVMEEDFYVDRLASHGLRALVPDAADRAVVDEIIFGELTKGVVSARGQETFTRIIGEMAEQGAEAVILACTEIELLFRDRAAALPLVDSMAAHSFAIATSLLVDAPAPA